MKTLNGYVFLKRTSTESVAANGIFLGDNKEEPTGELVFGAIAKGTYVYNPSKALLGVTIAGVSYIVIKEDELLAQL